MADRPIAYVLGTLPQASQTFIAREIRGLRARGAAPRVYALRRRSRDLLEAADRPWFDEVRFLPFWLSPAIVTANIYWLSRSPVRYARAIGRVLFLPHRPRVLAGRAFLLAIAAAWIARDLERAGGCRHVHAHFALAQTEVAMVVAALLGCPFTFTAHARDIYATPSALEEKMRAAALVVTCTEYNVRYLRELCPELPSNRIVLVHHGVPLESAAAASETDERSASSAADARPLIVAAGRLVGKKGFESLIEACARLHARHVRFRCRIYGDGPLARSLRRAAAESGLSGIVELPGWVEGTALHQALASATVFVMPSHVSKTGDRDGIPNVVLEAMAAGVAVVATRVSGIPEAVEDGVSGLLVPPGDPEALAAALQELLGGTERRQAMGRAGRARAEQEFELSVSAARLAAAFASVDDSRSG